MTLPHWSLIVLLAVAAFSIRCLGVIAGQRIRESKLSWVLDEVPGLVIVSLVAASLATQSQHVWCAAVVALAVACLTNSIVATMSFGMFVFGGLSLIGF